MAKYSSKPVTLHLPIAAAFDRISNVSAFQERIDSIPADQRAKMGDVKFSENSITLNSPQIGEIRFDVTERTAPNRIVFASANSPVPLSMSINLTERSEDETEIVSAIEIEIPAMLRPLIGGKMQEAADKFTELISSLNQQ
ncbi:MAG: hypothetical protein IJY31_08275 [Muribaculaceae bacterium]|nr:hypothetical protein [Muribaculaceae bacterium]